MSSVPRKAFKSAHPPARDNIQPAQPASLLSLPAELRNEIWAAALTSSSPISVDSFATAKQPALLQVNRQIRAETSGLYYHSNTFQIRCDEFDYKHLQLFRRHSRRHLPNLGGGIRNCEIVMGDRPRRWKNLIGWVKAVYEDEKMAGVTGGHDAAVQVARRLFRIAEKRDTLSWVEFGRALDVVVAEVRPVRAGGIAWT